MANRRQQRTLVSETLNTERQAPSVADLLNALGQRLTDLEGTFTGLESNIEAFLADVSETENVGGTVRETGNSQTVNILYDLIDRVNDIQTRIFSVSQRVQK